MLTVEKALEDKQLLRHYSQNSLTGLAISYLMEKAGIPDFTVVGYEFANETPVGAYILGNDPSISEQVMHAIQRTFYDAGVPGVHAESLPNKNTLWGQVSPIITPAGNVSIANFWKPIANYAAQHKDTQNVSLTPRAVFEAANQWLPVLYQGQSSGPTEVMHSFSEVIPAAGDGKKQEYQLLELQILSKVPKAYGNLLEDKFTKIDEQKVPIRSRGVYKQAADYFQLAPSPPEY